MIGARNSLINLLKEAKVCSESGNSRMAAVYFNSAATLVKEKFDDKPLACVCEYLAGVEKISISGGLNRDSLHQLLELLRNMPLLCEDDRMEDKIQPLVNYIDAIAGIDYTDSLGSNSDDELALICARATGSQHFLDALVLVLCDCAKLSSAIRALQYRRNTVDDVFESRDQLLKQIACARQRKMPKDFLKCLIFLDTCIRQAHNERTNAEVCIVRFKEDLLSSKLLQFALLAMRERLYEIISFMPEASKDKLKNMDSEGVVTMITHQFDRNRLIKVEELLEIQYDLYHDIEKELPTTEGVVQRAQIRSHIKRVIVPNIRELEEEYAQLLSEGVLDEYIQDDEAQVIILEVLQAVDHAEHQALEDAPIEMLNLLREIKEKLNDPGKTAAARLKLNLPIIPLIASYEMTIETEPAITTIWRKVRDLFKRKIKINPQ